MIWRPRFLLSLLLAHSLPEAAGRLTSGKLHHGPDERAHSQHTGYGPPQDQDQHAGQSAEISTASQAVVATSGITT